MDNPELSNEFDVLYNSITSNQAPGLDEYEKSVFLTKAQDEMLKSYFNPRSNKTQEGFDGNERRQIDFSMITRSLTFETTAYFPMGQTPPVTGLSLNSLVDPGGIALPELQYPLSDLYNTVTSSNNIKNTNPVIPKGYTSYNRTYYDSKTQNTYSGTIVTPFKKGEFDDKSSTRSVELPDSKRILMFVNEYLRVKRNGKNTRLTVVPIGYTEYNRLNSKPFKYPIKNQAWRLINNFNGTNNSDLIVGPDDSITQYTVRYIARPTPIILTDLTETGLSIDGLQTETPCILDPILHPEIVQRAVELAKAAYMGGLESQLALGQASETGIGVVAQGK